MGEMKETDMSPKTHREMDPEKNLAKEGTVLETIGRGRGDRKRGAYQVHGDPNSTPPACENHGGICLVEPMKGNPD